MGELILFANDTGVIPHHLTRAFGTPDTNTDLSSGVGTSYPIISIKGKVFHVAQGDERTLITNDDGDAKGSIEVVILQANPGISKVYYPGGYVEGSEEKPACYSNNGKEPAADAQEPQCTKCAICPNNAWGSRVTESGAKGKACSDSRRLAVASLNDLENPMLLRVPAATLKELTGYADLLTRRKVPYKAVVTKIAFDHSVAHPKLTFKPTRFLSDVEADIVIDVLQRPVIAEITGMNTPTHDVLEIEGTPPAKLMDQSKPKPTVVKKHTATEAEVEEVLEKKPDPKKTEPDPKPKADAKPKAEAKPKAAPKVVEADEETLDDILAGLENDD
jgi:hypothetical protein